MFSGACAPLGPTVDTPLSYTGIKTHDSESQGQEEAAIIRETKNTQPLSELFTRKTVQKIAIALTKPP